MISVQINIVSKKEEPLLSRAMIKATIDFDKSTPSYPEVISMIASQLKTEEKLVAIRHIYSYFGSRKAEVVAYIYPDENKKQFIEPKIKEKKEKPAKISEMRVSSLTRSHSSDFRGTENP